MIKDDCNTINADGDEDLEKREGSLRREENPKPAHKSKIEIAQALFEKFELCAGLTIVKHFFSACCEVNFKGILPHSTF